MLLPVGWAVPCQNITGKDEDGSGGGDGDDDDDDDEVRTVPNPELLLVRWAVPVPNRILPGKDEDW